MCKKQISRQGGYLDACFPFSSLFFRQLVSPPVHCEPQTVCAFQFAKADCYADTSRVVDDTLTGGAHGQYTTDCE